MELFVKGCLICTLVKKILYDYNASGLLTVIPRTANFGYFPCPSSVVLCCHYSMVIIILALIFWWFSNIINPAAAPQQWSKLLIKSAHRWKCKTNPKIRSIQYPVSVPCFIHTFSSSFILNSSQGTNFRIPFPVLFFIRLYDWKLYFAWPYFVE